jgi:hypothetical protein
MEQDETQEFIQTIEDRLENLEENEKNYFLETLLDNFWPLFKQKVNNQQNMLTNLKLALKKVSQKEHPSGLFRALLGSVCGDNISNTQIAKTLEVSKKAVGYAKRRRIEFNDDEGQYTSLLQKPIIIRVRIDHEITESIIKWMEHAFTPSSNTQNVVRKKDENKNWEFVVKHWRTETFDELMASYLSFHPNQVKSISIF